MGVGGVAADCAVGSVGDDRVGILRPACTPISSNSANIRYLTKISEVHI
jgi:hypothetical protein